MMEATLTLLSPTHVHSCSVSGSGNADVFPSWISFTFFKVGNSFCGPKAIVPEKKLHSTLICTLCIHRAYYLLKIELK